MLPYSLEEIICFPIYKKGKKTDVINYRGIAALCATSKLFELIVLDFLKHNCLKLVSETQHGFIEKRSTSTNLVAYTSFIIKSMKARKQIDSIYTDFSAAFDKINHQIMIAKLNRLGICGSLLAWLQSYLLDRTMSVKIGDTTSSAFRVTSGVPQGSHIGPFLFLLYLNDVNSLLKCFKLSYADDFKLFYEVVCHQDAVFLQNDLDIFTYWCTLNRMSLNPSKCSAISFGRKRSLICFDYSIAGETLNRVTSIKDLGVILDSNLNFNDHISYITAKASKSLGFIFRAAKRFTDVHCLKTLYCSLARSTLEYAVVVWAPYHNNSVQRIEWIQHKFIRFALRHLPWNDPFNLPRYEDRCSLIDLPLLENRRNISKACFIADVLQSRIDCPCVLNSLNIDIHRRTLRSYQFLRLPTSRTNYGHNEPIANMSRLFNKCYHFFDFNLSRSAVKRSFSEIFRT